MIERLDHVGVVVDDLDAAIAFFVALGLEQDGRGSVDGDWVGRIIGLDDPQVDFAFVRTPDGRGRLELIEFRSPVHEGERRAESANVPGIRHLCFAVDDLDATLARLGAELVGEVVRYENVFRLAYVRGPAGIIVELAERIG